MDEDADLGDGRLLLWDHTKIELADHLGLRGVVRFDGVPRVLDDRGRVAAEDGRAFLVRVELGYAFWRQRLERRDEEVGRGLALGGVEDRDPLVVEEVGAPRAEDWIERGDDRVALHAPEDEAVFDLAALHRCLAPIDNVVPGRRRRGEHVIPIGQGLQVTDSRQGDEFGRLVLEALHARALARRPETQVRERSRVVGVHLDPVRPKILEDPRGGVLRDPRVVHDVDVVLPRLRLSVLEGFGEKRVIRLGQELDLRPGGVLEHGDDGLLEWGQGPVLERADDELAAGLRWTWAGG